MWRKIIAAVVVISVVGIAYAAKTHDITNAPTAIGWTQRNLPQNSISQFYVEDFEGGALPSGWTVTDGNGDGMTFYVESVGNAGDLLGNLPPVPGNYILYYSDDDAGSGSPPTIETASVTVSLPAGLTGLYLGFGWGLAQFCGQEGLFVTVEGDTVWDMYAEGSGMALVDISSYAGNTEITLTFNYDDGGGCWGWAGAFDNITLSETPPPPPPAQCCIFEDCGPFPSDNWLADMAYDNTRGLMYQLGVDNAGSNVIIWDPATCDYCVAYDNTTGTSQRGIAYNPEADVIYVGGWNQGILYTFAAPQCEQALELLAQCDLTGTGLEAIAGLAWDDDFGGLFVQPNAATNTLGKIDPSNCSVLWTCTESFYFGGDGYDAGGLAYAPEEHGLYAVSMYDNTMNFFLNPENDDCVADTFCYLSDPVSFGWGVGQVDGDAGEFWVSQVVPSDFKDYHGDCILPVSVSENSRVGTPSVVTARPNPFTGSTEISFVIARDGKVNLSIYDASGRLVTNLVNSDLNAGRHTVVWNAENVPSGIYFYKLVTQNLNVTKKLVLMK